MIHFKCHYHFKRAAKHLTSNKNTVKIDKLRKRKISAGVVPEFSFPSLFISIRYKCNIIHENLSITNTTNLLCSMYGQYIRSEGWLCVEQPLQEKSTVKAFNSPAIPMLIVEDGPHHHGIDPAHVLHIFSVLILSTFMVEVSIIIIWLYLYL